MSLNNKHYYYFVYLYHETVKINFIPTAINPCLFCETFPTLINCERVEGINLVFLQSRLWKFLFNERILFYIISGDENGHNGEN